MLSWLQNTFLPHSFLSVSMDSRIGTSRQSVSITIQPRAKVLYVLHLYVALRCQKIGCVGNKHHLANFHFRIVHLYSK